MQWEELHTVSYHAVGGASPGPPRYLLCDVEGLAVGVLVEPHAAVRLSNDGVVRLLQPLRIKPT